MSIPTELTQALSQFVATSSYHDVPPAVLDRCKILLLDTFACALAGHRSEETAQVAAFAAALAQSRESSVIGDDGRLSLAGATLLNAYLVTAVTMCDVHPATGMHVTPVVVPPTLAIAERDRASGRELLLAMALGCEVAVRVGNGLDPAVFRANGWHAPGVIGPFGAAAAVGRLRGFDSETMARAFALAGSQAAGTFAAWGTPMVKFHQCRGALSGLMAGLLAETKFRAPVNVLTAADGGMLKTYAGGGSPDRIVENLARTWQLEEISLRLWPAATTIQPMITALFELIQAHDIAVDDIERLDVALSPEAFRRHAGFATYSTRFEALLSAHYVAAAILFDRILTLDQFEPAQLNRSTVREFGRDRVTVTCDDALSDTQSVVVAHLRGGQPVSIRCDSPAGSARNPAKLAQIMEKLQRYGEDRTSASRIEALISAIMHLEDVESVSDLLSLARRS